MKLRKNIVSVTSDKNGKVIEEIADYIGVEAFAKEIYNLYRECLDNYDDKEEFEQYINDLYDDQEHFKHLAEDFAYEANKDMKRYLHMDNHRTDGNFANIKDDYPYYRTGTFYAFESNIGSDEYNLLFPRMVERLDAAEDSERANDDRKYLSSWFFFAFGTFGIKYNFSNDLAELHYAMEECYEDDCVPA